MGQQDFKIRVLPRKNEKPRPSPPQAAHSAPVASDGDSGDKPSTAKGPRWIIYIGTASVLALIALFAVRPAKPIAKTGKQASVERGGEARAGEVELTSVQDPISAKVTRHLQDAKVKEEMMRRRLALDNIRLEQTAGDAVVMLDDDSAASRYGIQMDQENTAEKVYRDLTYRRPTQNTDHLPDERISARLANRKWMNEHERAERITFVRNFIRSAYDRGYQVEIDQNLVVVGVKKIPGSQRVTIDQIIDRMAKQGF